MDVETEFIELRLRRRDVILRQDIGSFFFNLILFICKGCELIGKHTKCALAVSFLVLEAVSFLLDELSEGHWSILLAEFLLSAFGFVMTIFICVRERTRVNAEKQIGVVEVVFSAVQLIATFLAVLDINIRQLYSSSLLLLLFAVIGVVFAVSKDENIFSSSSLTNDYPVMSHSLSLTPSSGSVNERLNDGSTELPLLSSPTMN